MAPAPIPRPVHPFPPEDICGFLAACAGEWLTLRSIFDPGAGEQEETAPDDEGSGGDRENWHRAERGELVVAFLEPRREGEAGALAVTPPAAAGGGRPSTHLLFLMGGTFRPLRPSEEAEGPSGSWRLAPDGSLELTVVTAGGVVRERIWFTKPNLRLRSTVEHRHDGRPGRVSFSSEIRRVRPPAGPSAAAPPPA